MSFLGGKFDWNGCKNEANGNCFHSFNGPAIKTQIFEKIKISGDENFQSEKSR